jgi:uncharacterized protein (TIGR00296 family)
MLNLEEGTFLVKVARAAVESHLTGVTHQVGTSTSKTLAGERGVFVTLLEHERGNALRGCIGVPYPTVPLIELTKIAAVEAATSDYRFEPLEIDETRSRIVFEITVMSSIETIYAKNPLDLRENVLIGRDGLVVEGMGSRGLLLPQVAVDQDFDNEEFLSQCCLKADLPPDAWLTGSVKVSRFQAQVFAEERPNGPVFERDLRSKI